MKIENKLDIGPDLSANMATDSTSTTTAKTFISQQTISSSDTLVTSNMRSAVVLDASSGMGHANQGMYSTFDIIGGGSSTYSISPQRASQSYLNWNCTNTNITTASNQIANQATAQHINGGMPYGSLVGMQALSMYPAGATGTQTVNSMQAAIAGCYHNKASATVNDMKGLSATAGQSTSTAGCTIGEATSIYAGISPLAATVTAFSGMRVLGIANTGTIGTLYGLRLDTTALINITTKYGIHQADTDAPNYFGSRIYVSGGILEQGSGGIGYGTGSGGTVTQTGARTVGVTINKTNGEIVLVSGAGTTTWVTFSVSNSTVVATDVVHVCQKNGSNKYVCAVTNVRSGGFDITFSAVSGTSTEQPIFSFVVIKAVTS